MKLATVIALVVIGALIYLMTIDDVAPLTSPLPVERPVVEQPK